MKYSWKRIGILILLAIFIFTSCSKPKINVTLPLTARLSNYNTILINVTTTLPETSKQVSSLEDRIVKILLKRGYFEKVVPASFDPEYSTDIRLDVKLRAIKKAGLLSAFFFAGAGAAVEVTFLDRKTGNAIGGFEASYSRSRFTTGEILGTIAKEIVDYIEDNL